MFPGQGSQSKGMGGALFDEFTELTDKASSLLGYSIRELCLQDPANELSKTQFTQPALYVVNALSYLKKVQESKSKPDFLAGHSLGELNALQAAGAFDFETGLRLVRKRGELMGQVSNGAMAAILNASKQQIEAILKTNGLNNIDLANYNTPAQIVISGQADEITRAQELFQQGRMRYYPLNTSGAFHSRFMRAARDRFREFLSQFSFGDLTIPVIANVTARPYENGKAHEPLANQIASTVRWSESIQYLLAQGLKRAEKPEFEEVGHGDVLMRMLHTIRQQTPESALAPYLAEERQDVFPPATPVKTGAAEKVAAWNRKYPLGTKVKSLLFDYQNLETRSEAVVLFSHRAAVYMKGYNGYFDLDELIPAGSRFTLSAEAIS
jgi:malonyl CoA-acyl carrier protein transacylase